MLGQKASGDNFRAASVNNDMLSHLNVLVRIALMRQF